MICKNCNSEVSKGLKYCPHCGNKLKDTKTVSILIIVFSIILVCFIVASIIVYFVFKSVDELENREYIEINQVKIANIFYESGYDICSVSISNDEVDLRPCKNFSDKTVENYVDEMSNHGYLVEKDGSGYILSKETENHYNIIIKVRNKGIKYSVE